MLTNRKNNKFKRIPMFNIQDLHLEKELLPLIDFTPNEFSRKTLQELIKQPLGSIEEILHRQLILKGFIANNVIFKNYTYSRRELLEVLSFLKPENFNDHPKRNQRLRLLFSEQSRHRKASNLIQSVLFLNRIQLFFIARINLTVFPENYKKVLININDFLSGLNLPKYELLIREQNFKVKHILELSDLFAEAIVNGEFEKFWKHFFLFEAYLSISLGILKHEWAFPTFSKKGFTLIEFYHPMLLNPVSNSFTTNSNVILITGPNMSGKSTFLKAVGLCIFLGHIGLGVPAKKAEIPFVDTISISINLNDDILSGYSHFMTELINLKKVITEAAENNYCFAVFDELLRGTNNEDAIEISATTIKGLTKFKNSIFLISTHLQELKELAEVKEGKIATFYIDCELKNNNPKFTYELKEGWSNLKVGRILFEKEGLNKLLG
jgi:DNA mismatch repair protein MutS